MTIYIYDMDGFSGTGGGGGGGGGGSNPQGRVNTPQKILKPPKKIGNPPEILLIFNIPNYSLDSFTLR